MTQHAPPPNAAASLAAANAALAPERALRILMVCTRDPRGRMSGRKMVLRTILGSLTGLGHHVTVCHFGSSSGPEPVGSAATFLRLPLPRSRELALNAALALAFGDRSINEALYDSRRAHRMIAELIAGNDYDLVLTDMIRTAGYGERSGLPWIADLDDLLSARYAHLAEAARREDNLFGYHQAPLMRRVMPLLGRVQPLMMRLEAGILARREVEVARAADLVSLVSEAEAARLARRAERVVADTPMAIEGPAELPELGARPEEAVFLGGLDYGPNLVALRRFDREVMPALAAGGIADLAVSVVGVAEERHRAALSPAFRFRGYVEALDAELQRYRWMLVPEVTPGGIKTKIITAALNGTVVLAHISALDGMGMAPGRNVLAWDSGADLAAHVAGLRGGTVDAEAIARAARDWAIARHDPVVLRERWRRNLALCLSDARSRAVPRPRATRGHALTNVIV